MKMVPMTMVSSYSVVSMALMTMVSSYSVVTMVPMTMVASYSAQMKTASSYWEKRLAVTRTAQSL